MKKIKFFLCLFLFSSPLWAAGASGWQPVSNIRIEGVSFISIHTATAWSNPDNCGKSNLAIIPLTDAAHQQKLSIALAAYTAGKRLAFWFVGCKSTPWGYTAPVINTMTIGD